MHKKLAFQNSLNSQEGFSLVEIMIGFALLGVLSVFVISMFEQQNKLTNKVKVDNDLNEIRYHFLNAINDKEACEANLQAMKKGDNINFFRVNDGAPFATVGQQFKTMKIKITAMKILTDVEVTASGDTPEAIRESDGRTMVTFRVNFEKLFGKTGGLGGTTTFKDFRVSVTMGEHKTEAGPTPASVKGQCNPYLVADTNFVTTGDGYQDPAQDQPVECSGGLCMVDCVRFTPVNSNFRILSCVSPGG